MITETMKAFIEQNAKSKVWFSELLTPEGKPLMTGQDFERCDRAIYKFEDGSEFILTDEDKRSAPDFLPDWGF